MEWLGSGSQSANVAPEGPGCGGQSVEAVLEGPKPGSEKDKFASDEDKEQPLYNTALMTATAQSLRSTVGKGLSPAEAMEPEGTSAV